MTRPYARNEVRPEYYDGLWDYALGTPATQHPRYDEAVAAADACGWGSYWLKQWGDVEASLEGCYFAPEAGQDVCDFLEMLVLSQGQFRDQTMRLLDWQRWDMIMPLYGWMRANGTRRYTQGCIWVPKKNGKSGLCSGLALYHLGFDGEGAPLVWTCAIDKAQAGIVYNEARRMTRHTPGLEERFSFVDHRKIIRYTGVDGEFMALSADVEAKEGMNWSFGIFDELHVASREMWSTLSGGAVARTQPMKLAISTAGIYNPNSIGWEQWEYTSKVLSGAIVDTSFFALCYAADPEKQWDDPANIKRANPSLGVIQLQERMDERVTEARNTSAKQADFQRYHLNIWVHAQDSWLEVSKWTACAREFDKEELSGETCVLALDLSDSNDMTACAAYFPWGDGYRVIVRQWLPGGNVDALERQHGLPHGTYRNWVRQGHLRLTPGDRIDHATIMESLREMLDAYNVIALGFDPYNASGIISTMQAERGDEFVVPVRQGMITMGVARKLLEDDILASKIEHLPCPVLDWQISNCSLKRDAAGNAMLSKSDGKIRNKIDGIVAIAMARWLAAELKVGYVGGTNPEVLFI